MGRVGPARGEADEQRLPNRRCRRHIDRRRGRRGVSRGEHDLPVLETRLPVVVVVVDPDVVHTPSLPSGATPTHPRTCVALACVRCHSDAGSLLGASPSLGVEEHHGVGARLANLGAQPRRWRARARRSRPAGWSAPGRWGRAPRGSLANTSQSDRPITTPSGMPITTPIVAASVDCHAITAASWRRVKPSVFEKRELAPVPAHRRDRRRGARRSHRPPALLRAQPACCPSSGS